MATGKRRRGNPSIEAGSSAAQMASYIMVAKLLSFALVGISFIIVVRILGPSEYGVYVIAIAAAGLFGALGSLGVSTALTKFLPEFLAKKDRSGIDRTIADGMTLLLVIGAAFSVLTFLLSGFIAAGANNPAYAPVIALASLVVLLSILFGAAGSSLVGLDKGRQFAAISISMTCAQAALSVLLALMGWGAYAPLTGLIVGFAVGLAVSSYLLYVRDRVRAVRPTLHGMWHILRFSWPIGISGILNSAVNNIVPIALGLFATSFVLGNFGVVSKVSTIMDIVTGSIAMALLPSFASSFAKGTSNKEVGKYYSYAVHFSFAILAPIIIAVIMLAQPVAITAFSAEYTLAPDYVRVFALGLLISIFGIYTSQLLISANKLKALIKYSVIVTAIQLALIPVLIPELGGMGAVVLLYLATPLLTDVFFIYAIRKDFGIGIWFGKLSRAILANLAIAALLLPVLWYLGSSYLSIIVAGALILVAYPPLIAVSGGLSGKDLKTMKALMHGMPLLGAMVNGLASYAERFSRG